MSNEIPITDDILMIIVRNYIPVHQWLKLEHTSKQFQRSTTSAYRSVRKLNVGDFFPANYPRTHDKCSRVHLPLKDMERRKKRLRSVLEKISAYFSSLVELGDFSFICYYLTEQHFQLLASLPSLSFVDFTGFCFDMSTFTDFLRRMSNFNTVHLANCNISIDDIQRSGKSEASSRRRPESVERQFGLSLKHLSNLSSLSFKKTLTLDGRFLSFINVESIKSLTLDEVAFSTDLIRRYLLGCVNLEHLHLSMFRCHEPEGYGVDSSLLPSLSNMTSLKSLSITYCTGSESTVRFSSIISMCNDLRHLNLTDSLFNSDNGHSRSGLVLDAVISGCRRLESLSMYIDKVSKRTLRGVSHLQNLRQLSLKSDHTKLPQRSPERVALFSDFVFNAVRSLTLLESVELDYIPADTRSLKSLADLPRLSKIQVKSNGNVNDKLIIHWGRKIGTRLRSLKISQVNDMLNVTDLSIGVLAECCPNIQHLDVSDMKLTDVGVAKLAEGCRNLEYFGAFARVYSSSITLSVIINLLQLCSKLTRLSLNYQFAYCILLPSEQFQPYKYRVRL